MSDDLGSKLDKLKLIKEEIQTAAECPTDKDIIKEFGVSRLYMTGLLQHSIQYNLEAKEILDHLLGIIGEGKMENE